MVLFFKNNHILKMMQCEYNRPTVRQPTVTMSRPVFLDSYGKQSSNLFVLLVHVYMISI